MVTVVGLERDVDHGMGARVDGRRDRHLLASGHDAERTRVGGPCVDQPELVALARRRRRHVLRLENESCGARLVDQARRGARGTEWLHLAQLGRGDQLATGRIGPDDQQRRGADDENDAGSDGEEETGGAATPPTPGVDARDIGRR